MPDNTSTLTQLAFLRAYRQRLLDYDFFDDDRTLSRYMIKVTDAIAGHRDDWTPDSIAARNAYAAIGGKYDPTLNSLRQLPAR